MDQQKFGEADMDELEITEDYVVLDDTTTGSGSHLDLSNLRKRKTKIISSAKETIENGECSDFREKGSQARHIPSLSSEFLYPESLLQWEALKKVHNRIISKEKWKTFLDYVIGGMESEKSVRST